MTKQERIIVSAYTGYMMCDFDSMHKYIEEILGRPVFTHELARDYILKEIREKVKPDFIKLCEVIPNSYIERDNHGRSINYH